MAETVEVKFKRLSKTAILPKYSHDGDSGMDVYSDEDYSLGHDCARYTFHTGIAADIPEGYELQVRPRSGLASKHGIVAMFGTVDQGYRGEIGVTLVNFGHEHYLVKHGERIAQLVLAPVVRARIVETEGELSKTSRGDNGFGSTGK